MTTRSSTRLLDAVLSDVSAEGPAEAPWLRLVFRTTGPRAPVAELVDRADLGPELDLASAAGIARILRLLRAARIAAPRDARVWLGDAARCGRLVRRALGAPLLLEVRPRSSLCFRFWTEHGVERVDGVSEVLEHPDAFQVRRLSGALPLRIPRDTVVRHESVRERWYEITSIDRPEAAGGR